MIFYDRLQFAFTITFHYLFPQLTMGLSLIIVYFKWKFLRTQIEKYNNAAKFFMQIFAVNFTMGVVTGIPMEFQFGTNWAKFSELTGGIIGQTLAMEGLFSFFLESSFLVLFIFGEKLMGQKLHFITALLVFIQARKTKKVKGIQIDRNFDKILRIASKGDIVGIKNLIKEYPQLINRPSEGHNRTILWEAVNKNRIPLVDFLIQKGADVNIPGRYRSQTFVLLKPYCIAVRNKNESLQNLILSNGHQMDLFSLSYLGKVDEIQRIIRDNKNS